MVMVASLEAAFNWVPEKEDPEKAAAEPTEARRAMAENFMIEMEYEN
jgi:hypothetical protein